MTPPNNDDLSNLRTLAGQAAAATDEELAQELESLKTATRSQLEALKPQLSTDSETFEQLLKAVDEATQANESLAAFADRIKSLGKGVLGVAQQAAALIP